MEAVEPVVTVTEGHQAVLTLQRTGSAAGPSSVSYRTTNGYLPGQAVAGQDFGTTSGVVTFKPGQRAKRIRVPTIADRSPETAEHFVVVIEDPHGTAIGGTAAVDVQIQDAS